MDITDDQAKLNKSSTPFEQHATSGSSDHVIPQMVITSADDASDETKNISECTLVLIPPSNGHSTDVSDKNTSAEFTDSANSVTEEKPVVDFEDISIVVRDVVSRCTESVSHSVRQRPLVMEVEKHVQPQELARDDGPVKCPPPPPPVPANVTPPPPPSITPSISSSTISSPPTTMQRPLIFDGAATKPEFSSEIQKDSTVGESYKIKEELVCDIPNQDKQFADIPTEKAKSSEECSTPTKKEGLQGVKKFFDYLLHHEHQDSIVSSEEQVTQKESDVTDSFPDTPKSNKSSVKKFFNAPQNETSVSHPQLESDSENKESTSFAKDAKQSIKAFFGTFKHESVEPKDSVNQSDSKIKSDQSIIPKEVEREGILSSTPESSKDSKQTTSFTKDTKENIKAFFDTFKVEPIELKFKSSSEKKLTSQSETAQENINQNLSLSEPESPKEPKETSSFSKDTKQNIKAFFDTFKHEPSEQKLKSNVNRMSASQPNIGQEQEDKFIESPDSKRPKTPTSFAKDTKQNIKAFFDTFKHEPTELKSKENVNKLSASQPVIGQDKEIQIESSTPESPTDTKESSSFVKDTKHNIKTFFDTFRHESSDQKHKDTICTKSQSQPDFSKDSKEAEITLSESPEISKSKESSSFAKGAKQNVKSFFDSFKSESSAPKLEDTQKPIENLPTKEFVEELSHDDSIKPDENVKESSSFAKEAKQNIKTFFDSFKHDSEDIKSKEVSEKKSAVSEPDLHKETETHKDSKHSLKKLFSIKHTEDGGETSKSPDMSFTPGKESSKGKLFKGTKSVKLDLNPQYSSNGAENAERLSGSVSYINGHDKELISENKERARSVPSDRERKKLNIFPEIKKPEESTASSFDTPDVKSGESKGIKKKFFDSFKHGKADAGSSLSVESKKEGTKEISAMDLAVGIDESKTTEKSTKDKKSKSIKRSLSDKVNREEMVQNFKGFFESIGHKSTKKSMKDSEHIYDVVEVKSDADSPIPVIQISEESTAVIKSSTKSETHGVKKMLSSLRSKDVPKSGFEHTYEPCKPTAAEESKSLETDSHLSGNLKSAVGKDISANETEPATSKSDKSSMFNAIGENILALKEKVLHTKEKRKSELIDDSVKLPDSSKVCEIGSDKDKKISESVVIDEPSKENTIKMKPVPPEKPVVKKPSEVPSSHSEKKMDVKVKPDAGPGSLYDTCCMKIAVLLRDKALDIVADRTKSPPPKPPKPSAEAIAKARAATVSRRIAEAKRMGHSVGENLPYGCDGMRYADDETESSCDYKDVENFDYIMDYELINRYKLDSSKLDTFSVPSTCSGLTSYYTADTITLRDDIYSDAVMETVSLNSDVSYNFKQLSSSTKSDSKTLTQSQKEGKSKIDAACKESSAVKSPKKIPPPVPPKPLILQNISKIKGKPDDKAVSQCVNGLSLSPRLKNKFSKDPAATQKRPLLVADIKGTQFSSLQHPKTKKVPPKPARNFNTVLKNESLKNVCDMASGTDSTTEKSIAKPSSLEDSTAEKITTDLESKTKIEKRTKSPPRPPPPNIAKKPEKPPKPERPPPPVKSSVIPQPDDLGEELKDVGEESTNVTNFVDSSSQLTSIENTDEINQNINLCDTQEISDESKLQEVSISTDLPDAEIPVLTDHVIDDLNKLDSTVESDIMNNNVEIQKETADSLNNNIELTEPIETPKPPPRNRRVRSRTVEIVPSERSEERLKRSQSLSEIDVQKRVTFLNTEKSLVDSKSLYTVVNKDGKRSNTEKTSRSSPDLVSCRPLPAPPPPPRRFRSLERKGKSKRDSVKKDEKDNNDQYLTSPDTSLERIKAPSRRRKTDKERFLSLHSDQRKEDNESLKRAESLPLRPSRKLKRFGIEQYDVNANISSPLITQENLNLSNQNIPNAESTDSLSKSMSIKDSSSRPRSHSSWYDECDDIEDYWEIPDEVPSPGNTDELKHNPLVPIRRKSESKRKNRETSKFYVNVDEESGGSSLDKGVSPLLYKAASPVPLVDKETSPLPLDCSEKSVQTSLETLSRGIVSHEDSEDTDELLDLAQTLQKELSTIIHRHKNVNESNEDTPSPPLSAAASEKNLADLKELKKISSVRSSTSEVWPVTSSDESDVERVGEDSSNINEVARKRKHKKIFYIAQEIMTSEETFVDALKLLNVDFKAAVEDANKQKSMTIIPDDVLSQILNHLPQLQHLNENLLMELKDRVENWEKSEKIADIIVKMGPFLKLYSWYIHDFESNVSLLEDSKRKYPVFAQVVKEFEMSARCKRLTLNHYMLKPIQRIPQYRLLLQEYLHHLSENSKDYQDTVTALQIVSEVANHANDSMKHGDNAQKLISIQNSIMGHKEIVKPGRVFVKEGELMKLSRKGMQPRWFILFNDLLLYLTSVQQGLYRINHELPLTGMKVAIPIQQDYQNEFSIISVTRSFTLAARSPEERQEWIIALTKAIEENASKRSTFTNSRLLQNAQDKTSSEDEGAFVLGKKAPVWIPDARVTMCQLCTSEFTVTFRRHHCRACGKVVCSICSSHRISLPYLGNRIARVCDECHVHLGQGSSACTESGETDSENQQIAVKPHLRTDNRHMKKNKRMLPSVLKEVCANDQGSTISGYLHKKTGKSWKRDWFVVKDKVLYEYKASEDVAALRSTPLLGYAIESFTDAYEGVDTSLLFQLTHPGQAPIIFYADTVGSAERWVSALKTATVLE